MGLTCNFCNKILKDNHPSDIFKELNKNFIQDITRLILYKMYRNNNNNNINKL